MIIHKLRKQLGKGGGLGVYDTKGPFLNYVSPFRVGGSYGFAHFFLQGGRGSQRISYRGSYFNTM